MLLSFMNSKLDTKCTKGINVRGRRKEDFDKSVFVNATDEKCSRFARGEQNEAMGILAPWLLNIDPMMSPP